VVGSIRDDGDAGMMIVIVVFPGTHSGFAVHGGERRSAWAGGILVLVLVLVLLIRICLEAAERDSVIGTTEAAPYFSFLSPGSCITHRLLSLTETGL
jgi:hypothetical protein